MKKILCVLCIFVFLAAATGCSFTSEEQIKLRDLDFTILSQEAIPEELKNLIDEKKNEPFMLTYTDKDNLYICKGYGKQNTGGYSITVNELYLTEDAVYAKTTLLGPQKGENTGYSSTCPWIVIKTEKIDKTIIFK